MEELRKTNKEGLMGLISRDELRTLIEESGKICVTMYLPTIRAGDEVRQNVIRFKNMLGKVEEKIVESGKKIREAEKLLEPAKNLLNDDFFWLHQLDGLAVFLSNDVFFVYRLPHRFEEISMVSTAFHMKPLLPVLIYDKIYYILSLDLNALRFYSATKYGMNEIALMDMPLSLGDAMKYEDYEKALQFTTKTARIGGNRRGAMFFGTGAGKLGEQHKVDILRFFQMTDREISARYLNKGNMPLVLAGTAYLLPLYREANSYNQLVPEGVELDPASLRPQELHKFSWECVEKVFRKEEMKAIEKYHNTSGTGGSSDIIAEIVPAAYQGRVEYLFFEPGKQKWGKFDYETHKTELYDHEVPGSIDLIDFAVIQTFLNHGKLFTNIMDLPTDKYMAAVYRY